MRKKTDWATQDEPAYGLPHLTWVGRLLLVLRWLALVLVLALSLFDHLEEGLLMPPLYAVMGVAAYNLTLLFVSRHMRWLRRPLNFLALDTIVATLATYLTGGYHSGFFILYVFNVIGAAFYMDMVPTILVTLIAGLIYAGACAINPAGLWAPTAIYIVAAKLLLLLVVAVLCALLLEQLRREHQETEQERVLAIRLSALNELLRQLSTSLDLKRTLHTVTDAARHLLAADVSVLLLRDEANARLSPAAASGFDLRRHTGVQLSLTDEPVRTILTSDIPQVVSDTSQYPNLPLGEHIQSYASAPLQLNGEPLGILFVGQRATTQFDDDALSLLQALAQEAALAIRNARLYQQEREQVQQLRTLDQLQRSFISAVSHELRTPLTCIKTSVDLLRDATPAVQIELLDTVTHHTGRLEALVTDLLESTRLEAGQVTLATQPTDLRRIVERTVTAVAPLMEQKEQQLETSLPDGPALADMDRRRIEQALTNLLANAHKFTPKGGHIRVTLERKNEELTIAVADDGPGIPSAQQVHLFQRFYVIPDGTGKVGLGLGLYITRQLVELHGGRVWLESQPARGSTFFIALPVLEGERYEDPSRG
ncbi:MAG: GAF domain-containing sensor histidine kinase [Chloroflexota bacterium]|nr:GAF domain-containing sensor histidine kinase [Chloroflexota bacterium]